MSFRKKMPKATGSMEGFYRSLSPSAGLPPSKSDTDLKSLSKRTPPSDPPGKRMTIDPTAKKTPEPSRRSPPSESKRSQVLQRQRSSRVMETTFSPTRAAAEEHDGTFPSSSFHPPPTLPEGADPSMVCTVAYRGMEVMFGTTKLPTPTIFCICARTRVALQTLDLLEAGVTVVSMLAHPLTGMVVVTMSNGMIQTYFPKPTVSRLSSDPNTVVSPFGKYRWVNGCVVDCEEVFYGLQQGDLQRDIFRHASMRGLGEPVTVSCSSDFKILVAHRDQLAVFDVTPVEMMFDDDGEMNTTITQVVPKADLLWTVRLERTVEMAKLSGDGKAVVVVVEGEGLENDNPFGARTFLRDAQDGSDLRAEILEPQQRKVDFNTIPQPKRLDLRRSTSSCRSVGILYRPGPFLVHPASVSRISFRGFGHNNSDVCSEEIEGNDLLLTYCRNGSSIRVFSQNSWKELIQWNAPPNTRADFVQGISAFNVGDLESTKRRKKSGSAAPSRRPSFDDPSMAINADLLGNRPPTYQGPNTAAGAWIVEVTFRNGFPAIRLSRLSYMKRSGDELMPAHFESVAAILPSMSLSAESVLAMDDAGFSVQGVWPAWNPWRSESTMDEVEGTLGGSAMALLGLSSTTPTPSGFFGEHSQAGTHGPPSELRLVASHPENGKIILMEFPLWGDEEFGAMELGSPIRYEFSLPEIAGGGRLPVLVEEAQTGPVTVTTDDGIAPCDSLEYDSSILCGQIADEGKLVAITWRKPGSMSVLPVSNELEKRDSVLSVCSSDSVDSLHSHSHYLPRPDSDEVHVFKDLSVVPVPLSLSPLRIPHSASANEVFVAIKWWSDLAYSGLPRLLAVTSDGTLLLYEMSPPWSALEPPMPSDDMIIPSAPSSLDEGESASMGAMIAESEEEESVQGDYDVMITPHPDFGIGLRLEAQIDGMPAIAGSYKKHPLNGGKLPAERTGMIVLGDELVSVNGISLEGLSFDDIIATVRKVGSEAPKGSPICMKFRPMIENRRRMNSSAFSTGSQRSEGGTRRTMEQILGVNLDQQKPKVSAKEDGFPKPSSMSSLSKVAIDLDTGDAKAQAELETRQELWRTLAVFSGALSGVANEAEDLQARLVLLPWHNPRKPSLVRHPDGEVLLVFGEGTSLHAKRLELAAYGDPHNAKSAALGSIDFTNVSDYGETNPADGGLRIRTVEAVPTDSDSWCVTLHHADGTVGLTFIERSEGTGGVVRVDFRCFSIFQTEKSPVPGNCIIRASSVELFATLSSATGKSGIVSVWCSSPSPTDGTEEASGESDSDHEGQQYVKSALTFDDNLEDEIVDIRFVQSGSLNAFPWIVSLTPTTAVVHRRDGGSYVWKPIVVLKYPSCPDSSAFQPLSESLGTKEAKMEGFMDPAADLPHLIPTLRALVPVCDERYLLRSDWHPETILAYICSDANGVRSSFRRYVKGLYSWLSMWLHENEDERPMVDTNIPLVVVPLRNFEGHLLLKPCDQDAEAENAKDSASSLMWSASAARASDSARESQEDALLQRLQSLLCPSQRAPSSTDQENAESSNHSNSLPEPLTNLSGDEIRLLWAIGEMISEPPRFKSLDPAGQLTAFTVSLLRSLDRAKNIDEKDSTKPGTGSAVNGSQRGWTFLVKQQPSSAKIENKAVAQIASAGCLSAITSSSQGYLLECCRVPNEKLDWETARLLRLPFWVRSDTRLRAICEEVGQATFRQNRDILDCALFFIIARNMRTLRNLAMTDQSTSGKTFFKFITEQDFSSQRGRKAAEKNAFSLLRKRRYQVAASFFLLAEPPMLKSALEVIVTQMEDLDLAFLVARMMECPQQPGFSGGMGGFGMGVGGFGTGVGGMFGAGGGYASGGTEQSSAFDDEISFDKWKPCLKKGAKDLINERGLAMASDDPCLQAIQLIWLRRREEASWCLSGFSHRTGADAGVWSDSLLFPKSFDFCFGHDDIPPNSKNRTRQIKRFSVSSNERNESANERVLRKANSIIDFVSRPFLVKSMNASLRSQWSSTLLVSRALTRRGIDLVSTRSILQYTDPTDLDQKPKNSQDTSAVADLKRDPIPHENGVSSSIFDSFDRPTPKKPQPENRAGPSSSIFDSFDAAPPKPTQAPPTAGDPMNSSIFAGFDAAPVKRPIAQKEQVNQATSSIFDSFDTAPQTTKPSTEPSSSQDPMASSIFDAFDAPPPKKDASATQSVSQSGEMTSSIFDSFDAPKPSKQGASTPQKKEKASDKEGRLPHREYDESDEDEPDVIPVATPKIWIEWRDNELIQTIARRLLREMASVMSRFHGDTIVAPMKLFRRHFHPLVPTGAGEILVQHCIGNNLVEGLRRCLDDVCSPCKMSKTTVVNHALRILSCPSHPNRVVYTVLLYTMIGRPDQAENIIRDAASGQIQRCEAIASSNDQLVENRKTSHHMASQYLRRLSSRLSWQLEICLWLNRGGAIPLSAPAVKEAVIAVRCGLVVASWGRSHVCLEALLRCEPDSPMDEDAGRQLWSSLKLIVGPEDQTKNTVTTGSGGWEFLVDCRRGEATEMLRNKPTGTFIIRPHPEDTGVFTLSFKTNLIPTVTSESETEDNTGSNEITSPHESAPKASNAKPVRKDDVVQHAIIRLSDAGFRCGSFGPFATLLQLLEAVSGSLPFDLLFNKPPTQGIIRDEGEQPSPDAVLFRKLALTNRSDSSRWNGESTESASEDVVTQEGKSGSTRSGQDDEGNESVLDDEKAQAELSRLRAYGMFVQLVVLSDIRKQLCAVAAAECDDAIDVTASTISLSPDDGSKAEGSIASMSLVEKSVEECYAVAVRIVRPLLNWCRLLETSIVPELAPSISVVSQKVTAALPVDMDASETAIELASPDVGSSICGGDAVLRRMIQPESGVEFRTLRVGEGTESAMIVLFGKNAAVQWLVSSGAEANRDEALARLVRMEKRRVIEPVDITDLSMKTFPTSAERKDEQEEVWYRFVDPWEVEGLENREAETMAATLGRESYYEFSIGSVASSCEDVFRRIGGYHLLGLWSYVKGGLRLTKGLASVYAPWERDMGGDLQMAEGVITEPPSYVNSIREHLYRNALFRVLKLPQRFLSLVQVELLDLKNLTAPGGSPSLTVFALLRLKRPTKGNPLTYKAKTLDCITTQATKVGKSSGPNAAASWGSVARFRFPLPEDVNCDGVSHDGDREALFKGAPSVLQISVYEKKFMSDIFLGAADINLDALTGGGQLEEWVPLRASKHGISWFTRIRLTLRFELMCLGPPVDFVDAEVPPSVGLVKIQQLSKQGGAHEDVSKVKKSVSTSDLLSYFESMVS